MTQVKTLLADARLPRLEVRMLLEHVLQKPRAWLLAHDTDPLPAAAQQAYEDLARRLAGEPMAIWSAAANSWAIFSASRPTC